MPISDEVIELEPVKKSKSKFIVLIAIAAVMFALAATFLVLFLVKPGGSGDGVSGKVNEVTVNSSALFTSGSDSKLYASMGTEYTIYANASVDGDRSDDITWEFTPYNAFADENLVTGKDESGPYCRFKPNSAIADGNTAVTITAKSSSDPSVYRQIQFYVVKQGTEHIKFLRYTRGANSSASNATTIAGDEITVPHYFKNQNNSEKFYVAIEQLGAYNSDTEEYSPLTLADGYCAFSVESSNPSVIEVPASDVVQMTADQAPRFALRVLKMSDEPVTITVRANSAVARLTVNVKSSAELGYIESIYVVDQPIGTGDEAKAFFDKLVAAGDSANWHTLDKIGVKWLSDTTKNSVLTLPYMANYNNILSHVVLSPLSLQYDATKKEILNDWRSMISVTVDSDSKIKDAVNISKMNNTVNIICNSLANNLDCMLSFTDSTRNSIASSSATVKLNIVARNSEGEASVKLGNDTYDSKIIEELISKDQGVPISTGNQATLTVTYRFRAPASTHPELMLSSGYVSTGFKIRVDYLGSETGNNPGLTVKVGRTDIDDPDKIYNFSTSLSITHVDGSQNFTGNAPIQISVSPGAFQGKYNLTFEKIGTSIIGASFNDDNQNWTVEVPFDVTPLATSAEFITAKEGKELLSSNKVGMFAPPENYGVNNGIKTGIAELYVQNRSSTEPVQWKVTDFIRVNGSASYDIQSSSNIAQETSRLLNQSLTSDYRLRFTGRSLPIKADDRELRIDIKVRPQGDSETTLADFVIYVHVVDSVSSLSCSSGVETKKYGGNEDSFETFQKDNVSPFYVYSRQQSSYSTNNFELGFASNINDDNSFEAFEETPVGKKIEYRLKNGDGAVLFEFDGSSFVQKADLFEKSVKARRNISHIKVRYYLNDTDRVGSFCVGEPENIFAEKKYIFSRNADEIGVYTDPDYTDKLSLASFEYSKTINAGVREHFYVSAIINLSDDTLSGGKIIVNSDPAYMAIEHEDVYVTVDPAFTNISGTAKNAEERQYYDFVANAPTVALGDSVSYVMDIHGCGKRYKLNVNVQNRAKPLSEITLLSDSSTALTTLDFVNSNFKPSNNWYTQNFIIKVKYVAGNDTYSYYEPFTLNIPECFDYEVFDEKNNAVSVTNDTISPSGDIDTTAKVFTYTVKLTLKTTAAAMSNGEISVSATSTQSVERRKANVNIGVGLDNIKFKIDENVYSTKDGQIASVGIKFANNSASSSEIVRIPLEFITLGGEEYTNIAYDFSKLTVPNGSGISVEVSEGKRTLLIALPANTPNTGNDKKSVSATFTDAAFGANKTFTVKLEIAVTHDVFSVSQPSNGYAVTTTGGSENQTVTFSPIFNNGESDYEPESIGEYSTSLVLMSNDAHSYTSYSGAVTINGTTITVPNTVYSSNIDGKQLCVCVKYGNLYSYAPINITTTAVGVRYKSGIAVSDSAASVKITASANSFTLVAVAYNLGNGEADLTKTITYKLYSDSAYKNEITTGITIGNDGVITFTEPPAYSGKIYYRASVVDAHYDVAIDYTVDIASVELFGISSDVLNGNNITMYYVDSTHNTTLDLFDHIKVNSVLSGMGYASGATLSVESSAPTIVSVSGNALYSVNSGTSIVTISATYNGTTVTHDYNVTVVGLSIVLDKENATVDITKGDSVSFTPTVKGGNLEYKLNATYDTTLFGLTGDTTRTVTLNRSAFGEDDYKSHAIVGKYVFSLPEGSSLNSANGLIIEKPFRLTVTNSFEFAGFELKDGNTPIAVNGKVPAVADKTYTIQIPNYVKDEYHSYSVRTSDDEIATATLDETSGLITVTPVRTAFGNTYITVAITAYGKTIERTQNYNFVDEVAVTTSMKDSSNNDVTNDSTVQIDYTTAAPTFTYALTVGNATVTVDNVHFTWSGDVEPSVDETNKSVTFTVSKPTTLTVIGYVEVDGRRYYGDEYKLTLDATAPVFTLDAKKGDSSVTEILPNETAAFSVSLPVDTQFQGEYTVSYAFVVANGEGVTEIDGVASFQSTTDKETTVKPDLQRTDDRAVVVRATVTVSNGAYAGQKYVLEKSLTIKGVPLPTISVIETSYRRDLDTDITLADCINISTPNGVTVSNPKFSIPNDINYTFNGGVFTVSSAPADNRRDLSVGGKIEIGVSYTVTSEVNNGRQIPDSNNPMEIVIYINPTVTASGKTITEGRKGSYDIKNAVSIATGEAVDSFKSTDDYIVDYTLSGYNAGVSVDGSTLTLDDNVTGGTKTVTLSAKVTITSGVHAGAEISVGSVTVTVQPVPQHTVTFDSKGGSSVGDAKVLNGDRLNKPDDPTLTGHTFGGWYKDEGCTQAYDFNSNDNSVTSSFPLYAKWTPNRYTVTFDANGGTTVTNATVNYGAEVTKPDNPTKTGYDFGGWYWNGTPFVFKGTEGQTATSVTSDITLVAKWTIKTFTVTFYDDNGTTKLGEQTVEYYHVAVEPKAPTKIGHTFKEWQLEGSKYAFDTHVTKNVNLVAYYEINKYTVKFNYDCADISNTEKKVNYNATVAKPTDPTRNDGYTFDNWYLNGAVYNFADEVKGDITLVAKWTIKTYTVTFDSVGGSDVASQNVTHGGKVIEPKDPTKDNAVFGGWYKEEACINVFDFANETITDNTTIIYAKWTAVHTVTFKLETGDIVAYATQKVLNGGNVTKPSDPTKAGHTFVEWQLNGTAYNFETATVTGSITLVADWTINTYTVLFYDEDGATLLGAQTVTYNNVLQSDDVPAKNGHSVAWFTDKQLTQAFALNTPITANTTLYAKWTINTYLVTFNVNGGNENIAEQQVEYGKNATKPTPDPTRDGGYVFVDWFEKKPDSDELNDTAFDFSQAITGNVTLYAKWMETPSTPEVP